MAERLLKENDPIYDSCQAGIIKDEWGVMIPNLLEIEAASHTDTAYQLFQEDFESIKADNPRHITYLLVLLKEN